jgi:hypothetical protein
LRSFFVSLQRLDLRFIQADARLSISIHERKNGTQTDISLPIRRCGSWTDFRDFGFTNTPNAAQLKISRIEEEMQHENSNKQTSSGE